MEKNQDKNPVEESKSAAGGSSYKPGVLKIKLPNPKKPEAEEGEIGSPIVRKDEHFCSECNKSFSCGKALGGHMSSAHVQANKDYSGKLKSNRSIQSKNPRSDPGAMSKNFSCTVCNKEFRSMKSVYGHMRSHPERNWRGVEPPASSLPRVSEESSADTNYEDDEEKDDDDDDDDDDTAPSGEAGNQIGSASMATKEEIDLAEALVGFCWGETGKRGREGVIPCAGFSGNPAASSLVDAEVINTACLLMCMSKSWLPRGRHPLVEYEDMLSKSLGSNPVRASGSKGSRKDGQKKNHAFRRLGKLLESGDNPSDEEVPLEVEPQSKKEEDQKQDSLDDEYSHIKACDYEKENHKFSKDDGKGKKVMSENKKTSKNMDPVGRVSESKRRSRSYEKTKDGPSLKRRRIGKKLAIEDQDSHGEASIEALEKALVLVESETGKPPFGDRLGQESGFYEKGSSDHEVRIPTYEAKENHRFPKSVEKGKKVMEESKKNLKIVIPLAQDDTGLETCKKNAPLSLTPRNFACQHSDNSFTSYQALGGHVSSHTPQNCVANSTGRAKKTEKIHQCKTCNQLFPTGQALGGHQRCHWNGNGSSNKAASSEDVQSNPVRKVLKFDLNESPPVKEDDDFTPR